MVFFLETKVVHQVDMFNYDPKPVSLFHTNDIFFGMWTI